MLGQHSMCVQVQGSDCITDSLAAALTYLAKVAADPLTPL